MTEAIVGMLGLLAGQASAAAVLSIPFRSQLLAGCPQPALLSSASPFHFNPGVRVHPTYSFSIGFRSGTFTSSDLQALACNLSVPNSALPPWLRFDRETITVFGTAPSFPESRNATITCADRAFSKIASDWFILEVGHRTLEVRELPEALQVMAGNVATLNLSAIHQQITIDGAPATKSDGLGVTLDSSVAPWLVADGSSDVYRGLAPDDLYDTNTTLPVIVNVRDRFEDVFTFPYTLAVQPTWFINVSLPLLTVTPAYPLFLNLRDYLRIPIHSSLNVTMTVVNPIDPIPTWLHLDSDTMTLSGMVPPVQTVSPGSQADMFLVSLIFTAFDVATGLTSTLSQEILVDSMANFLPFHNFRRYSEILLAMIGTSSTVCALGLCLLVMWACVYRKREALLDERCKGVLQDGSRRHKGANHSSGTSNGLEGTARTSSAAALAEPIETLGGSYSTMSRPTDRTPDDSHNNQNNYTREMTGSSIKNVDRRTQGREDHHASIRLIDRNLDLFPLPSRHTIFFDEAICPQLETAPTHEQSLDRREIFTGQTSSLYRLSEEEDESVVVSNHRVSNTSQRSFLTQGSDESLAGDMSLRSDEYGIHAHDHRLSRLDSPISEHSGLQRGMGGDEVAAQNWLRSYPAIGQPMSNWTLAFTGSPELGRGLSAFSILGSSSAENPPSLDALHSQPAPFSIATRYNFDPDAPTPPEFYSSEDSLSAASGGSGGRSRSKESGSSTSEPVRRGGFRSKTVMTPEKEKVTASPMLPTSSTGSVARQLVPGPSVSHTLPSLGSRSRYMSSPESEQSYDPEASRQFTLKPQWDWSLHPAGESSVAHIDSASASDSHKQLLFTRINAPRGQVERDANYIAKSSRDHINRSAVAARDKSVGGTDLSATWEF